MNKAYLLTGGNIGNRTEYLKQASAMIAERLGKLVEESSIYETEPWGVTGQSPYLNQVLLLHTSLLPNQLLDAVLSIEHTLGRERNEKFGARTIDIDLLLFNDAVIHDPGLSVPHPQLAHRRFVLTPLAEIAGDVVHPVYNKTISALLEECKDSLKVNKLTGVFP